MHLSHPGRFARALLLPFMLLGTISCSDAVTLPAGDGTAPGIARTRTEGLQEGEMHIVQRDVTGAVLRSEVGDVGEALHRLGGDKPKTVADSANLVAMLAFIAGGNTKPGKAQVLPVRLGDASFTLFALERTPTGRVKRFGFGDASGRTQYIIRIGAGKLDGRIETYTDGQLTASYQADEIAAGMGANEQSGCFSQFLAAMGALGAGVAGLFTGNPVVMGFSFLALLYGISELSEWLSGPCGESIGEWITGVWDDFASWWCSSVSSWPACGEL